MVRDSAVYSLSAFRKQQQTLGESQVSSRVSFIPRSCSSTLTLSLRPLQRICDLLYSGIPGSHTVTGPIPDCQKLLSFAGQGHFRSLYEMGNEEDARLLKERMERQEEKEGVSVNAETGEPVDGRKKGEKGWRYGAVSSSLSRRDEPHTLIDYHSLLSYLQYVQTTLGISGPADLVDLGNGTGQGELSFIFSTFKSLSPPDFRRLFDFKDSGDEPDFSFDWHLTFSTSSPLKIAVVRRVLTSHRSVVVATRLIPR